MEAGCEDVHVLLDAAAGDFDVVAGVFPEPEREVVTVDEPDGAGGSDEVLGDFGAGGDCAGDSDLGAPCGWFGDLSGAFGFAGGFGFGWVQLGVEGG